MPSAVLVVILAAVVTLVVLELGLRRLVRSARRSFQWLITERDTSPALDQEKLAAFLAGSFSPALGWKPIPGTSGEGRSPGGAQHVHD